MTCPESQSQFANLHQLLTEESWLKLLQPEFQKPYWRQLVNFLDKEHGEKKKIFPPKADIFNAFNSCPVGAIRVVILGQDPYIFPGQAHGYSFSVKKGVKIPPSLANIYRELEADLKAEFTMPFTGDLTPWVERGIFLLNTSLTVRNGEPNSHAEAGWQTFTAAAISRLAKVHPHLVFVLWGAEAQKASRLVDAKMHYIITSSHPSPKSAGFLS